MPVPKRTDVLSPSRSGSASPSSMSGILFGFAGTGNRGNGRPDTKAGKSFNRSRYSGLDMSGDVHVRVCDSFSKRGSDRERVISGTKTSSTNIEASSPRSGVGLEEAEDANDRDRGGVGASKNGSLGARDRLANLAFIGGDLAGLDSRGCDCARAWVGGTA